MSRFAQGKIEAFVGPAELGAPDDLEAVVVDFVAGARSSLDIAVQELDSEAITQAILDATYRGVRVRMLLEQDYLRSMRPPRVRPRAGEPIDEARRKAQWQERRRDRHSRPNREILAALLRCGVDVRGDLNPKIFHQKYIIRDYRDGRSQGRPALLTGSTNFTWTGTHRNLNHVIVFHDYRICRAYAAEFAESLDGTFGTARLRHDRRSRVVNIRGVPVRILFAPDDAPELEIVKQMLKARRRVDFAIFTFSGSSAIDDAMTMLRRAGIAVSGVLDKGQGEKSWAASHWLHDQGIEIRFPDRERLPGLGRLHHKLMVIDDDIVVAGSMNYTLPANAYNDENIFVIGSPYDDLPATKGGRVDHDACHEIAGFFRREIERIAAVSSVYRRPR